MSKIVARMEKMKTGNLGGIQRHNQRETDNHSNKEIDVERSYLNYDLVNQESINYRERIHEIIDKQRVSKRAVRKDAVLVDEWIITSDKTFFETADSRKFFEDSLAYFSDRCGSQTIAYATVHLDETTPHMHLGIVPMYEKRLSSKELFSRQRLKEIQEELPHYLQERGHDIERGIKGSEQKHLSVEEYKENQQAIKEMDQILSSKKNELVLADMQVASQQQAFTNELAQLWESDWLATMAHSPYFELIYEVRDTVTNAPTNVYIDEYSPIEYRMNFREIISLFKEKFKQFKEYIAEKWQKLTDKGVEIQNRTNTLEESENALETKLEGLNATVKTKETQSKQLTELIESKTSYVKRLAEVSELSRMTPDYVKPSKLNKDVWIVPKEMWEAKHISANVVSDMMQMRHSFSRAENQINRQAQEGLSNWKLQSEKTKLEYDNDYLRQENVRQLNGYVRLFNSGKITENELRSILSTDAQKSIGLKPVQKNVRRDKGLDGPSMSL